MHRIALMLALVAGSTSVAASASPAWADDHDVGPGLGIRLVDIPVAAADNPRARVYIIDHVRPGSVIARRVEVVNNTGQATDVALYPAAATIESGNFTGAEGHTRNELSSWTTITPSSPHLRPGEETYATVRIRVPPDAFEAERYAAAWAEVTTRPDTSGGITQVNRVGVRIYLSVGPGGEPASDFTIGSFTAERSEAGAPVVEVTVRNTGGRALDLTGEVELTDGPGGLSTGPFDLTLGTTLSIDQTESVAVALDPELPDGPWRAHVTMRSGLLAKTAQATLTFPDDAGTGEPVAAEPDDEETSWLHLAALFLTLLGPLAALVLVVRRRHFGSKEHETKDEAYASSVTR